MFYSRRFGYGFAIIMEDIGGTAIKNVLPPDGFAAREFLPIAIDIGILFITFAFISICEYMGKCMAPKRVK
jgi:hypothetical protein